MDYKTPYKYDSYDKNNTTSTTSYTRATPESYDSGVTKRKTDSSDYSTPSYTGKYEPSTYSPTAAGGTARDYSPTKYEPSSYSPTTRDSTTGKYEPSSYSPTTRDSNAGKYEPSSYSPTTRDSTTGKYEPSSYSPTTRDSTYSPTTRDSTAGKYEPSSYSPTSRDYTSPSATTRPSGDTSRPGSGDYGKSSPLAGDYGTTSPIKTGSRPASGDYGTGDVRPGSGPGSRPGDLDGEDGLPAKSSLAPNSRPSGDLTGGYDDEDIPMDEEPMLDDFGMPVIDPATNKPVMKAPTKKQPSTVSSPKGGDLVDDMVCDDMELEDVLDDMGMPVIDPITKKPVQKAPKKAKKPAVEDAGAPGAAPGAPGAASPSKEAPAGGDVVDDMECEDMEMEDVLDDMGMPVIDPITKKHVQKAPTKAKKPAVDDASKPADKKPAGDGITAEDMDLEDEDMGDFGVEEGKKKGVKKAPVKDDAKKPTDAGKSGKKPGDDLTAEDMDLEDEDMGDFGVEEGKKKGVKKAPVKDEKAPVVDDAKKPADKDAGKPDAKDAKKAAEEAKKAAEKEAADKKAADKEAADKKVADKKAADEAKVADKKAADEAKKAAEKEAADKKAADKEAADKKVADKKAADEAKKVAEKEAADKKAADKEAADKKAADKKAADEAKVADKKAADEAKKVAEKEAADKKAADKKAADDAKKEAADKKVADKKAADEAKEAKAAEKKAADEAKAAEKKAADEAKKAADKEAADKKAADDAAKKAADDAAKKAAEKPKTLGDLPADKLDAIMKCIEGGDMDFSGADVDPEIVEAIQRNISKINLDDEQNIVINFFKDPKSKEPTTVKLNIKKDQCKAELGNPRDGKVKVGDVIKDGDGKASKINLTFTPTGKKPINFIFSIKDGVLSLSDSDIDPATVYLYLTDADPLRRKLTPKEKRAKEAIISINLQDGEPNEIKLNYGDGKCVAEVINNKDTNCKVTKVVKNKSGDPELVTVAVTPKGSDKPMFLTFKILDDIIDLVSIEYAGQNVPMKRGKDGSLVLEIPGGTPERIVELNMKLGEGPDDVSKVTLNFPDGKTCSATSDDKSAVVLVEYKYDDAGVPLSAIIDVTPKGKKSPVRFSVVFKDGVPSVTALGGDDDEGQEIIVRFKLSDKDPEPCTVKMLVKDGQLTAEGDKKANVKVISSKFDGKGEPMEIKLELTPKDKKTGSLFFTCIMENGNLKVVQDQPKDTDAKKAKPASQSEPTEQELVVRFKIDPSKEPCVVKIGILGDECAAIGDKQASADVVDFKCLDNGEPDYIRLRLDPADGGDGIFFILRFINGQLSVEQEDMPPEVNMAFIDIN